MPATLNDIQAKYGEAVYPLYKDQMHEPYMENDNGIGYKGVVMYDEMEDKVQCAECGKWFKWITLTHLKKHEIQSHDEYKIKNGLNLGTPLCSKEMSEKHSKNAELLIRTKPTFREPRKFDTKHFKRMSELGHSRRRELGQTSIQTLNKIGLCDAQIASRWAILIEQIGKIPSINDLRKYDIQLLKGIKSRFGTLTNAAKELNIKVNTKADGAKNRTHPQEGEYTDIEIIAMLRKFIIQNSSVIRENRIDHQHRGKWFILREYFSPKHGLPSRRTIQKKFGSWRRAKMMAGLDQLLEEVKSER